MYTKLSPKRFNALSDYEKFESLHTQAEYLGFNRIIGIYKVGLFSMDDYYIEVWLNPYTNQLYKATAFRSYQKLYPFIKTIDLSAIYALLT